MIDIKVVSNEDGFIQIQVSGHTDTDICAAVSSAMQANVYHLQHLALQFPDKIKFTGEGDAFE